MSDSHSHSHSRSLIPSMLSSLSLSSLTPSLLASSHLPITIKLVLSHHDIRRITIPSHITSPYGYVLSLIPHSGHSYFTYKDDEGDTITVRTDEDLLEALRITAGHTLRLTYHSGHGTWQRTMSPQDEGDEAAAAEESFTWVEDDVGGSPANIHIPPTPQHVPGEPSPAMITPGEHHDGWEGKTQSHPSSLEGLHPKSRQPTSLSVTIPQHPSSQHKPSLPSSSSMPFDVYRSMASLPPHDLSMSMSVSPSSHHDHKKGPPPPPYIHISQRQCGATIKQAEDLYYALYQECEDTKRRLKHEMNAKMNTDSIEENNHLLETYARDKAILEKQLQDNLSALLVRFEAYVGSFPHFPFLNPIFVAITIHDRPNVRFETAISPVARLPDVVSQLQKHLEHMGERAYLPGMVTKCTLQKPNPHRDECDFELEDSTILLGDLHLPIGTRLIFYEEISLVTAYYQAEAERQARETHPLHTMTSASSSVTSSPAISPSNNPMNIVTSSPASPTAASPPAPTFSLSSFAAGIMSLSAANSQLAMARSPALRSFASPSLPSRRHSSMGPMDEKKRDFTPSQEKSSLIISPIHPRLSPDEKRDSTSSQDKLTPNHPHFLIMNPDYQPPKPSRTLFGLDWDVRVTRAASMPESQAGPPTLSHVISAPPTLATTGEADHSEPNTEPTSRVNEEEEEEEEDHGESVEEPSTPGVPLIETKHEEKDTTDPILTTSSSQLYDLSPSSTFIIPDLSASISTLDTTITTTTTTSQQDPSMSASFVPVTPMEASGLGDSHVWIDPSKSIELP